MRKARSVAFAPKVDARTSQLPVGDRDDLEDRHRLAPAAETHPAPAMDEMTLQICLFGAMNMMRQANEHICPVDND